MIIVVGINLKHLQSRIKQEINAYAKAYSKDLQLIIVVAKFLVSQTNGDNNYSFLYFTISCPNRTAFLKTAVISLLVVNCLT